MSDSLFIDSWGWIVLADQKDPSHPAVLNLYERHKETASRLITTDYVLDEVMTFLFAKTPAPLAIKYLEGVLASIRTGTIQQERIGPDRFQEAWKLRLRYQDKPKISFTDLTSFVVMKELGISHVLTNDHHFEQVNLGLHKLP